MMKRWYSTVMAAILIACSCNQPVPDSDLHPEEAFSAFETRFLDSYWKQYPDNSIFVGYGKYYENLVIPDSTSIAGNILYSKERLDSLTKIEFNRLSDNNKISYNIIKNQLESDVWYQSVFKQHQWDASVYNLSDEVSYILNQPYAPLDKRLQTLSQRLSHTDLYYQAAFKMLNRPTKESVRLAIAQNQGGMSLFKKDIVDSLSSAHLNKSETDTLKEHLNRTVQAINGFVDSLQGLLLNKNYPFRKFSIGKELFEEKFKYDLATNFTPREIYGKAKAELKVVTNNMYTLSETLWPKYGQGKPMPKDTLILIRTVVDAISLQHASGKDFFDSLKNQVYELKKFIKVKDLFDFDTSYPIIVRLMPEYQRGVALASAEFTPAYQKKGDTYYNIDDVTRFSADKMESTLREMNNYTSQLISIHEAMPGHCLQGIYNNLKSPDVLRSVFYNGAMVEGWAVYTEYMMTENGWGNFTPEMQIMHDKLKLREMGNVIIDYEMQCLDKSKEDMMDLMINHLFQTRSQAEEKYNRATLSQVQLCSYYTGSAAILALREDYKAKKGTAYTLKDFHENFLKYGSSPVKYIRERMMQ